MVVISQTGDLTKYCVFITAINRRKEVKIEEPSPLQLTILPDYHGAIPQPPLYKHCGGQLLDRGAVVKLVYQENGDEQFGFIGSISSGCLGVTPGPAAQ